jgi:hypothetical protein
MSGGGFPPVDYTTGGAGVTSVTAGGTTTAVSPTTGAVVVSNPDADDLLALLAGSGTTVTNTAETVKNQPTAGAGPVTQTSAFTSSDASPATSNFTIPTNSSGPVDVLVSAINATDGGAQAWRGKVVNIGGTTTVTKAFAAVDTWDATAGASTWTVSVAESVDVVTATVTGAAGAGTIQWTVVFQYVPAA